MSKGLVYLILGATSSVGSFIPSIFGAGLFSAWGMIGSFLGLIVGIYIVVKLNE